jgi:hypothetical protein
MSIEKLMEGKEEVTVNNNMVAVLNQFYSQQADAELPDEQDYLAPFKTQCIHLT